MSTRNALRIAFPVVAALSLAPSIASAQTDPRYFNQMRAELQAMGLTAQCASVSAQVGACRVVASAQATPGAPAAMNARRYALVLEYSDQTDTVYAYLDHYATLRADATNANAVFRRMSEMNWEMLVGKFEWSSRSGEVRLGAVLNTDSNFDRRAFRGVVRAVLRLGDRYAEEISHLTGAPVGETAAPTAPAAPTTAPAVPPAGAQGMTAIPAPAAH